MNVPDAIMLLVSAALTAALASIILLDVSAFDAVTVRFRGSKKRLNFLEKMSAGTLVG